ncbi:MAG: nucleotidyl transferase AbiEii/AbiGii toxin family protein [Acidobacteriota bacterium]
MDFDIVQRVLQALEEEGVRYAVFGGVALNLHGIARTTEDLDIFVDAGEDNISRLRAALRRVFDDPEIDQIRAQDLAGDYPAIQYVPPTGPFHVDIVARLGEAFRFSDLETQRLQVAGLLLTVVTPRQLLRMKKDTVRAKDRGDADLLRERFGLED